MAVWKMYGTVMEIFKDLRKPVCTSCLIQYKYYVVRGFFKLQIEVGHEV